MSEHYHEEIAVYGLDITKVRARCVEVIGEVEK